ncbi:colicin transporter [Bifidobacterium sp. CP2]|uniref:colicin transporter n=1 Tax=Bifidobacterium sp. CP2 TaxID=2809025 RepID=UPI001BDD1801|nr:colicin transporter [Bifidobacterium sp. CP2]MBT1181122.1 colicin transporter [Bifidobacterium sp. CP2]
MGDDRSARKPRSKWLVPTVAVVAVVALAVGGGLGWRAWTAHELEAARTACFQAADTLRGQANAYNTLVNGDAAQAASIKIADVKDAKTVDALAKLLAEKTPGYPGCTADDKTGLDEAATTMGEQSDWYGKHMKSLKAAVAAVDASHEAKLLDDAKTALKSSLDAGESKYKDTEGKVADENTRASLRTVLDDARKTHDDEKADVKALSDAKSKVDDAAKAVDASVKAKEEADRQAAEIQASSGARSSSGGSTSRKSSGGSTYRKSSGGSTYRGSSGKSSGGSSSGGSSSGNSNSGNSSGPDWWGGCEVSQSNPSCESDWMTP